jgi:hypothetical protein
LHKRVRAVFKKSLAFARESGYLKQRKLKAVLDTSYILGRGAVKDTYNLLGDGIVSLVRALAELQGSSPEEWAQAHDLARYFASASLKGEAAIDWEDPKAREAFLTSIVADADRLLGIARQSLTECAVDSVEYKRLTEAAEVLSRLLLQDIERKPETGQASLKEGVAEDRLVSVHDPEMRHGRKSKAKRFDGHKAALAVDPESQLITAGDVLAGNAPDNEKALELVEQSEENTGLAVEETLGDCAFGDGTTRKAFADAGRELVAKVPDRPNSAQIPKEDFAIDLEAKSCTCPAGQECKTLLPIGRRKNRKGESQEWRGFRFDPTLCAVCSLRASCVKAGPGKGRTVSLHPQEALLQAARAFQRSEAFAPYRKWRQAAEHRIARLMQLGMRQARYFGRAKTLFQLLMAAMVANLTLTATKLGLMRGRDRRQTLLFSQLADHLAAFAFVIAFSLACFIHPTHRPHLQGGVVG